MRDVVLDSHAILKFVQDEAGAEKVEEILKASHRGEIRAFLNEINLGEIYYITVRKMGMEVATELLEHMGNLPIKRVPATWDVIAAASRVKAQYALSYADCFAVASALRWGAAIVTGDPEFKRVEHLVEVDWI